MRPEIRKNIGQAVHPKAFIEVRPERHPERPLPNALFIFITTLGATAGIPHMGADQQEAADGG